MLAEAIPQTSITKELFTAELFAEIMPLAQKLWDECSEIKKDSCSFHGERGFKIQPDFNQYLNLQNQDSLIAMTLRDETATLQGFSISVLYHSLHHAPVKCANVDTFYIEPPYRSSIQNLVSRMEEQFQDREIVVVGWPVSPEGGLFKILNHLGYHPDDVVLEKRICALQQQ